MAIIKERVDRLEEAMMELISIHKKTEIGLQEFKEEIRRDTREFKEEVRRDTREFKEEVRRDTRELKEEMKAFKEEMAAYKDWSQKNIESLNQQWGNLANKMGTLVEDIFAPSIDIVLQKYFNTVTNTIASRYLIRQADKSLELDIMALDDSARTAYVVEVKSNPDDTRQVRGFLKKLSTIPTFIPALADYTMIGLYAGLNINQNTVTLLTKKKLYALVFRGDFLEILNYQEVNQNHFLGKSEEEKK